MNKFEQLGLNESLLKAILDLGFENPSEVQEKAIPLLLEKDTDMVALAQTGTGKTAAFGFPLIQKIDADNRNTQALVLSPTRELCLQITNELKNYSKYEKGINVVAVYGGASITEQAREIKRGAQIIVATPGRMQDMINRGAGLTTAQSLLPDRDGLALHPKACRNSCRIRSPPPVRAAMICPDLSAGGGGSLWCDCGWRRSIWRISTRRRPGRSRRWPSGSG